MFVFLGLDRLGREEKPYNVKVLDSYSRLIKQLKVPDKFSLNLSDYPSGIYMLQLITGTSVQTIKLIKQ